MLTPVPPMSNAERQRKFQAAHPGYDRRRKARLRAALQNGRARYLAELRAKAEAQAAASQAVAAPVADAPVKPVLMLPAPVEDPTMAALEALRESLERNVEHCPAAR